MSWVKIEDGLYVHPKIRKAGAPALGLHLLALSYCGHHYQAEGFIPKDELPFLYGCAQLAENVGRKAVQRLVEVGLWDEADEGYRLHDWLDYNPIADIKEKRRKAANSRWSRNASAYANASQVQSTSNARTDAKAMPSRTRPVPVPLTHPQTPSPEPAMLGAAEGPIQAEALPPVQGDNREAVSEVLADIQQRSGKPAISGFIRAALDTFIEVTGRQPTHLDMATAREWERDFRYLEAGDVRDRMRNTAGYWQSQDRESARVLKAFTPGMQAQNAFLADSGRRKVR